MCKHIPNVQVSIRQCGLVLSCLMIVLSCLMIVLFCLAQPGMGRWFDCPECYAEEFKGHTFTCLPADSMIVSFACKLCKVGERLSVSVWSYLAKRADGSFLRLVFVLYFVKVLVLVLVFSLFVSATLLWLSVFVCFQIYPFCFLRGYRHLK
jgi:hypothetical protein